MPCHQSLIFLLGCCLACRWVTPLQLLPPPLSVTCAKPENHVYQRRDHGFQVSCLWDRDVGFRYSKGDFEKDGSDSAAAPNCRWYRNSVLVAHTVRWAGQLLFGSGLPEDAPPQADSQITVQCISVSCSGPLCAYRNWSIEVVGQDVHLFLLWPLTPPILERQPVHLGWCARLKRSTWRYHLKSPGGHPADFLIPANQHKEPPPFTIYPGAELPQACASYYSYYLSLQYPHRGLYSISLRGQRGPRVSLSIELLVEPALLHVFSTASQFQSRLHGSLSLSWHLQPLSQEMVAYHLVHTQGSREWPHTYAYNPYALGSHFCGALASHWMEEAAVTKVYFRTSKGVSGEFRGELDFSNDTLTFRTNRAATISLRLHPQTNTINTYIFSSAQGLYYSTQKGPVGRDPAGHSSLHHIFYQQESLSYLLTVEFMQLQFFRFRLDLYLNRKAALFKTLGEKEMEVHVFNRTSPEESLVYVVWFIPVQHPLLQCEWTFSLQLFDLSRRHLVESHTFAYGDQVRNATQFIPGSALPFSPARYAGFVARVKCAGTRLVPATFKAIFNHYASKVIESQIACQQQPCIIAEMRIHRPVSPKHVLYYAQGTGFTLAADTQISCPGAMETKVIWNIYKVYNGSTIPDWSKPLTPPGIERRNFLTLQVPGASLDDGLYLFNFSMQLISFDTQKRIEGSDSVLVEIGSKNLGAVIAGGRFRTVGFSDRWVLNGSALSNGEVVSLSQGLSYSWYCTTQKADYTSMTLSRNGKCRPDQVDLKWTTSSDSIQPVLPKTLQANNVYHFLLVIQNGSRTAQTEQAVRVEAHAALRLNVACIDNCGASVIATERFCLAANCPHCWANTLLYYWSLRSSQSGEIDFDWSSQTTTGRSRPHLCIKASALLPWAEQACVLSLKVTTEDGQSSFHEYSFHVNGPPQMGKCVLHPRVGTAFRTKFTIYCQGFEDKNRPLTYKVIAASDLRKIGSIASVQTSPLGIIIYAGPDFHTAWFFLPSGRPSQSSALTLYVQVCDALGACSQVTLKATVLDQRKRHLAAPRHRALQDLIDGSRPPLTPLLITKDHFGIGYSVYRVASALNNIEALPTNQVSKADLRRLLLNLTAGISSNNTQEINQVILSICQTTYEITEVDKESQLLAIRKLKEVSEALKRQREPGLGHKETEILVNGILIGLSNVLSASLLNQENPNINAIKEAVSSAGILADLVLQGKVPGEHGTNLVAKNWTIHLWKDEQRKVSETFSERSCFASDRSCFYPKLKQGSHRGLERDSIVSTVLFEFEENPFPWLPLAGHIGTAVVGFKMTGTSSKGDTISILPDVVETILARKDKSIFDLTIGPDKNLPKTTGGLSLEIRRGSDDVFIQIVSKVKVTFHVLIYLGLNVSRSPLALFKASRFGPPTPIRRDRSVPDCELQRPYLLCLPWHWPLAQSSGADRVNISIVLQSRPIVREQTTKTVRIAVFTAGCLDLGDTDGQWEEGACSLGPRTSWSKIHCICKAEQLSSRSTRSQSTGAPGSRIRFLAGKVLLFPNQVDLNAKRLGEARNNPIPGLTVYFIFIIYLILIIWAKSAYETAREGQVIDLPDNDPFYTVHYLVTIYTGSRPGSGTKAGVFIELIGQNGSTDVHQLQHPAFPGILQGRCINTFILSTKEDLGDLSTVHVWHNYCGFGSNWYVSRIQVQNLKTSKSWLFLCRKWLALSEEHHQIEYFFDVMSPEEPISKTDYFLISLSQGLINDHLWVSICANPTESFANKFQSLSCCLAVLLTSLMFNAIVFSVRKNSVDLQYLSAIGIGIASAFTSFQVEVIALFLFSRQKPSQDHRAQDQNQDHRAQDQNQDHRAQDQNQDHRAQDHSQNQAQGKKGTSVIAGTLYKEHHEEDTQLAKITPQQFPAAGTNFSNNYSAESKAKSKKALPWLRDFPCSAWFFVFSISGASWITITVLGLSYNENTSFEWLIASLTSFCLLVIVFETLRVVVLSGWNALSPKYCGDITWRSYPRIKYKPRTMEAQEMTEMHNYLVQLRASKKYQPINEEDIAILQKKLLVNYLAYNFAKDMICHFIFLTLILIISHPIDTSRTFHYNQVMYNTFSPGLSKVKRLQDVYTWVNNTFLPLIHNSYQPTYLSDSWSKVLGLPRMRQIRGTPLDVQCILPYGLKNTFIMNNVHCQKKYGVDLEDQLNYLDSWETPAFSTVSTQRSHFLGFTYEEDASRWGYILQGELGEYSSKGYTFYFFPQEPRTNSSTRMNILETKDWLDNQTWVVIFELTTFNVDVDLFCSISVIFENSFIGPVISNISVYSYELPFFTDQTKGQIFLIFVTAYMLVIYIADECRMVHRERLSYVTTATNLINFGIKTVCIIFLLLLLCKFKLSSDLITFYLHHPREFIPFEKASQFDKVVRDVLGILVFLLILKTYRYLRFLFAIRLAQKSLFSALPGIFNLAIIGGVFYFGFMTLGHIGFGQHERNFRTPLYSFTTILSYCTLTFSHTEFQAGPFFGAIFLACFLLIMICVVVNLIQVIIISAHRDMKEIVHNEASNEAEVAYFLVQRIYRMWVFANTSQQTNEETDVCNSLLYGKARSRYRRPLRRNIRKREKLYLVI